MSGRRAGVLGVGCRSLLTSESELLLWFSDSLTRDDLTSSRSRCAETLSLLGSCSSPPSSWKGISSSFAPRSSPPPAAPAPEPPLPLPPPPPPPPPSWGMVGPRAGAAALRAPRRPRPARPGPAPLPPARPAALLAAAAAAATKFDRAWPGGKRGRRSRAERGRLGWGPTGSAEPRAPQLAAAACSAGASQRLARRGGASGAGRRARRAGQGGWREEPGCKLTPARPAEPRQLRRAHTHSHLHSHTARSHLPGAASPQRAPRPHPQPHSGPPPLCPTSHPRRPSPHPPANRWSPAHTLRQPLTFFQRTPRTLHRSHTPSHHSGALEGGTAPCGKTSDTDRPATLAAWSCSERGIPPSLVALAGYIEQRIREIYGTLEYVGRPPILFPVGFQRAPCPKFRVLTLFRCPESPEIPKTAFAPWFRTRSLTK